jgi:hypothetical protein
MSRGMSRGGSGFPIIIAVLGVLILAVIGIFIWMQLGDKGNSAIENTIVTMEPTPTSTPVPSPTPTAEVTPAPVVTVPPATPTPDAAAATPTPYITAAPNYTTATVWINVDALNIRTQANFDSDTVGKIPYGQSVQGDVNGKWMNTSYDGITGWIYLGKTSDGRPCVVYSEGALQPLEPDPDAPTENLVQSHTFVESGSNTLTLTITFTAGVYSEDDATGALQNSDFTLNGNTFWGSVSHVAGAQVAILTFSMDTGSVDPHLVTIKSQSVFKAGGSACTSQTFTHP